MDVPVCRKRIGRDMLGCGSSLGVNPDVVLVFVKGFRSNVVERRERAERNLTSSRSRTS